MGRSIAHMALYVVVATLLDVPLSAGLLALVPPAYGAVAALAGAACLSQGAVLLAMLTDRHWGRW